MSSGPREVTLVLPGWLASLFSSAQRTTVVLAAAVPAGFVVMALGWRGAARELVIPLQVPWLLSGGVVGGALVLTGMVLLDVHLERVRAARERVATEALVRQAAQVAEAIASRFAAAAGVR